MRTKQTASGSKSQHPKGMATATFSSSADADPEQQQQEVAGGDTEDSQDWPDVLEETMQGVTGSSTTTSSAGVDQNCGRTGEVGRQDVQRTDITVPLTKF